MFLLSKFAFPRIAEALDKRQQAIEESIDTAERTRVQADELLAEYRERLAEARSQADEIVARARRTGENQEAESLAEAKRKREELMEQTRREIEQETKRADRRRSATRSPTSPSWPRRRSPRSTLDGRRPAQAGRGRGRRARLRRAERRPRGEN